MTVMKCLLFLCLSLATLEANAGAAVSFIDKCHYNDQKCLLESSKKAFPFVIQGIPELGMPSFDPLSLEKVNGDNGDLKLKFKNMIVKNLSKCEITKILRPEKLKIEIELICPIVATGEYTLGGRLLVVDVEGDDKFEIKTDKIKIAAAILLKVIEKHGQEYYKFRSFDYKYDVIEKAYFTLHNLYHGDKAKAAPIISILDQNWKEIINEIGKPVFRDIITAVINSIGKFFSSMPRKELELE